MIVFVLKQYLLSIEIKDSAFNDGFDLRSQNDPEVHFLIHFKRTPHMSLFLAIFFNSVERKWRHLEQVSQSIYSCKHFCCVGKFLS